MTTTGTLVAALTRFGVLGFTGEDAQAFLQGQLSCDVTALAPGRATYGSYNSPKGRILATFLLWRDDTGYAMQLPRSLCEPIRKRLSMYVLRSKVKVQDASDDISLIGVAGPEAEELVRRMFPALPAAPLSMTVAEGASLLRLDGSRFQVIASRDRARGIMNELGANASAGAEAAWDLANIRAGIPVILPATQEEFVPQMVNLDLIGGVSFNKGCYPGQEIVARMHYLGRLKQRMYLAHVTAEPAPRPGDKVYGAVTGDQAAGMIVNAAPSPEGGQDVLAVLQIASARDGDGRLASPAGPQLKFLPLPYKIPD